MEDKKYYTPDITEFHIGYECEYQDLRVQKTPWKHEIIDSDLFGIAYSTYEHGTPEWEDDMENTFRTKYLDKEDIESEGWNHTGGQLVSWGRQDFEISNYIMRFYAARVDNIGLSTIEIMTKEDPFVMGAYRGYDEVLYKGICKSINQLRIIQKLLGIK